MRPAALPLISSLLALVVVAIWQVRDSRAQSEEHRQEHRRHGMVLLAAAEGLATRELRGGRYDPVSLGAALDDAVETFNLKWFSIATPEGAIIASAGGLREEVAPIHRVEKVFEPLRPRRAGSGEGPPWCWDGRPFGGGAATLPLEESSLTLTLILDPQALDAKLAKDLSQFLVTTSALALAILLVGGVSWMRARSTELRSALETGRRELANLERLRRLGAGLVHETKNPLGVVRGFAERILSTPLEPARLRRAARAIVDETDRTVARLDEFLLFSRPARLRRTRVAVRPLFEELAMLIEPDLETVGAELVIECVDGEIYADREPLRRLFLNLLLNATQAVEQGGRITLSCRQTLNGLELIVEDDGPGVPEALHETLFEPYVSMREGGSGLGLSIATRIAADHGFGLRHERREPRGTRMILEVPSR